MRSFILLTVIGLLAFIGQTVQIKFLNQATDIQPTAMKSFAEVQTERAGKKAKEVDYAAALEGVDPVAIMKGDPKAVFETFKVGVELVSGILENK